MKHLKNQLSGLDFIIRTHRSYLINLNAVTNISGNAQGFKLQFNDPDIAAHVSRKMIDEFQTRRDDLK
ncbi:MAG: LytTR family transcriptional regulator DNA-binding domain-containing protein [Proteobacteria bacterium]|nr:LytTR family transcriptional regulator DNA-binding domain-containing protein [Pseudomonadota bacterium]